MQVSSPSSGAVEGDESPPGGIQSVEIGMKVLTTLSLAGTAMPLAVLARSCEMPRSKAYKYLVSLERTGYVEREAGTGRYVLGGRALQVGLAALDGVDFVRMGSAKLADLSETLQETVFLSVWGERGPTIVRWEDAGRPIAVNVRIGSIMPLLASATGQVFGAWLPATQTDAMVAHEITRGEGAAVGVETEDRAAAFFKEVRRRGIGCAAGSFLPSIEALSSPVFGMDKRLAGSVTALGLKGVFDSGSEGAIAKKLRAWSDELTERMSGAKR